MQRFIFVVTVTRGSKTRYFYGERLKEALGYANLRDREQFKYGKFARGPVQNGRWVHEGIYETTVAA